MDTELGLVIILLAVFLLPFASKKIEYHLEFFLFSMGILSLSIAGMWSGEMLQKAMREPIAISAVVLVAGFLFQRVRKRLANGIRWMESQFSLAFLLFLMVFMLGLVSSMITAIIAALVLVEVVSVLHLSRKDEVRVTVVCCFAIGLGAVLTPMGEPLSTIVVARLNKDFWYLFRVFSVYVIPALIFLGIIAAMLHGRRGVKTHEAEVILVERPKDIVIRAVKVYFFVMALIFLGTSFKPLIDKYVVNLSTVSLYWLNMISAVLDNATLAAAEMSPVLSQKQITSITMGLLISGGMLIPGNIPNIIVANKLKITSKEWAQVGVPLGLGLMAIYFLVLSVIA